MMLIAMGNVKAYYSGNRLITMTNQGFYFDGFK